MIKPWPGRAADAAVLALLALVAAVPLPANAHSILIESQPEARSQIIAGQTTIRLRYNNRIDPARSRLTLTRPDRTQQVLPLEASDEADALAASAVLMPGAHVLRWQVLSIDGHIVRGDLPFSVKAP